MTAGTDHPDAGADDPDRTVGVDLTPRVPDGGPGGRGRRRPARRVAAAVVLAVTLGAGGGVVVRGLGDATLYFRNADEALAQRDELGDRRFRLQGTLADDVRAAGGRVTFSVAHDGARVEVVHHGDPPEMFTPGQAVVLEGRFTPGATTFASDRILVKHDAEYEAENPDRVTTTPPGRLTGGANGGGDRPPPPHRSGNGGHRDGVVAAVAEQAQRGVEDPRPGLPAVGGGRAAAPPRGPGGRRGLLGGSLARRHRHPRTVATPLAGPTRRPTPRCARPPRRPRRSAGGRTPRRPGPTRRGRGGCAR